MRGAGGGPPAPAVLHRLRPQAHSHPPTGPDSGLLPPASSGAPRPHEGESWHKLATRAGSATCGPPDCTPSSSAGQEHAAAPGATNTQSQQGSCGEKRPAPTKHFPPATHSPPAATQGPTRCRAPCAPARPPPHTHTHPHTVTPCPPWRRSEPGGATRPLCRENPQHATRPGSREGRPTAALAAARSRTY